MKSYCTEDVIKDYTWFKPCFIFIFKFQRICWLYASSLKLTLNTPHLKSSMKAIESWLRWSHLFLTLVFLALVYPATTLLNTCLGYSSWTEQMPQWIKQRFICVWSSHSFGMEAIRNSVKNPLPTLIVFGKKSWAKRQTAVQVIFQS